MLGKYYYRYVFSDNTANEKTKNPDWRDCTRYLAGFLLKVLLLNEWRDYYYPKYEWTYEFTRVVDDFFGLFEWGKDISGKSIYDCVQEEIEKDRDHYSNHSLLGDLSEISPSAIGAHVERDIFECLGIANDLFIGRRDSFEMYDEEYCTDQEYNPNLNWPHYPFFGPPYGRRPYLQGQDPPRSQAVIWVPFPILRFAFFAKEVALFGRSFDGMREVAWEQLEQLDSRLIHPEYFFILARVLELEDTGESRKALDILSNNLFLGEKPLTQAWVEGPQEVPWLR